MHRVLHGPVPPLRGVRPDFEGRRPLITYLLGWSLSELVKQSRSWAEEHFRLRKRQVVQLGDR